MLSAHEHRLCACAGCGNASQATKLDTQRALLRSRQRLTYRYAAPKNAVHGDGQAAVGMMQANDIKDAGKAQQSWKTHLGFKAYGLRECGHEPVLIQRRVVLHSYALPALLASLTIGSDDPTTLLNSVLGGYGLPRLPIASGFKTLDDFELDLTFEYPRSWVVRRNTLRPGLYISDFNTADKLSLEVFPWQQHPPPGTPPPPQHQFGAQEAAAAAELTPAAALPAAALGTAAATPLATATSLSSAAVAAGEKDLLVQAAVAAAVAPGAVASGQPADKLLLPPASSIRSRTQLVDGQEYTYLQFASETLTRSGYQVRRRNFAVVAVRRGTVYCLNASSRSDQFDADKEALLRHVIESFRAR
ncbi:hypothetical protein Agub_g3164 [Astrephomene gubernaculifera]|uniref:PsbP C-terminal domain-containing protein n=1 Tax=Astrephomene gubernaculifera TaxID=47775 RepID=A0AAD3DKT0_9CHLO|nr:hypothetical protein Agub_g3164 [Astrephomene gubernaculifera]